MRKQIKLLKNHAHLLAELIDIAFLIRNQVPFEPNLPFRRDFQQIQAAQKCAFPTARRPDNGNFLSALYLLIDAVQRMNGVELLMQILNGYHFLQASFRAFSALQKAASPAPDR